MKRDCNFACNTRTQICKNTNHLLLQVKLISTFLWKSKNSHWESTNVIWLLQLSFPTVLTEKLDDAPAETLEVAGSPPLSVLPALLPQMKIGQQNWNGKSDGYGNQQHNFLLTTTVTNARHNPRIFLDKNDNQKINISTAGHIQFPLILHIIL